MLPIPKNNEQVQLFRATEKNLFDEYFFKINKSGNKIGIRSIFYDETNQTLLVSNVNNGNIYILNLITGKLDVLDNHKYTVRKVGIVGDEILTASWDNSVRVFNKHTLKPRLILTTENMGRCPTFEVSPDHKWVYSFSYDSDKNMNAENIVRKWSLKTGRLLKEYRKTGEHFAMTRSGSLFLYKKLLGVGSDSGYLNFFDARTGKLFKANYMSRTIFRSTINIGEYAFLADISGNLHKFSMRDQMFESVINYAHSSDVTFLKHLIKDGNNYVVSTSFDGKVKIWSFPDLEPVTEIATPFGKWALTFVGENILVAGDLNGNLLIYDITKLEKIKPKGVVRLFSDGKFIAYKDKKHGQSPIRQFFSNDLAIVDTYKGKPNEEEFLQLPWHMRPIVKVTNDRKSSENKYEEITGKQSEYILNANNNIDVFHELFQDANIISEKESTRLSLIPLLQGNVIKKTG